MESNMCAETKIDLLFAVPFDHSVFVEADVLGTVRHVQIASCEARLEFPKDITDTRTTAGLLAPASAPRGFSPHLPEGWGLRSKAEPQIEVAAILVVVPFRASPAFPLTENQIGGKDLQDMESDVSKWFESFCHWLWVLTSQSLDPIYPDPKVLSRRSKNPIIAASTDGRSSVPSSGSVVMKIVVQKENSASERLIDARVLDLAARRAGVDSPSIILELLASARTAARRGDARRAFADAGTAAEGALSRALQLHPGHQITLGGLVGMAQKQGIGIAGDAQQKLVDPRNDAVHRGQLEACADIARAIEIAEELVLLVESELFPVSSLRSVNRPQRQDLIVLK
jgi:hypothetical protein